MPEEGRAQLRPLCLEETRMCPRAPDRCRELPAGHHHAAPGSHAATARLHWPGRSDRSLCHLGQRMPGFAPLVAQTHSQWGHPVFPGCGDTGGGGPSPFLPP